MIVKVTLIKILTYLHRLSSCALTSLVLKMSCTFDTEAKLQNTQPTKYVTFKRTAPAALQSCSNAAPAVPQSLK